MSGRIDNAIMDDNSDTVPMKSVWPYLSITLTVAVEYLDELSSQYIVNNIVFLTIYQDINLKFNHKFTLLKK